jgi:hypothetical protein
MQHNRDQTTDQPLDQAVLYLCAFVVSASGLWAVAMTVQDAAMTRAFGLALVAGFAVSWLVRPYPRVRPYALLWSAALAIAGLWWYFTTGEFMGRPVAEVAGPGGQVGVGLLLAGLVIARSFGLVSADDLLFCAVPSLAIFGVIGSYTFDPQFTLAFLVYVFAAAYLAGQAHLMAALARRPVAPGQDPRRVARERLVMLAALIAACAGVALPVARVAAALLPQYRLPLVLPARGGGIGAVNADASRGRAATGSSSWISPGQLTVGAGPLRLSRQVVMRVKSEQPLLWRGESLYRYTGSSWEAPRRGISTVPPAAGGGLDLRPLIGAPPGRVVKQEFKLVNLPTAFAFAAMQPLQMGRIADDVRWGVPTTDRAGSLFISGGILRPNASYEVQSQVDHLVSPGKWSVLDAGAPELLQIPPLVRDRVREFARHAVGDIRAPQAQVEAIISYLHAHAAYSLDAPATPPGEDAVIHFLTRSRVGYCDLFASAAALMCRAVGIPARVATGYAPGAYDSAAGVYVVRGSDAHAWVEAYLPQRGWIAVDAAPAGDDTEGANPARRRTWFGRLMRLMRGHTLAFAAALAVLAWAAMAAKARWLDDYLALRRRERGLRPDDYRGRVILSYEKLLRALARRRLPRRDWETPYEYARRVGQRTYLVVAMRALDAITTAYLRARFSRLPVGAEHAQAAGQALRDVTQALRRTKDVI